MDFNKWGAEGTVELLMGLYIGIRQENEAQYLNNNIKIDDISDEYGYTYHGIFYDIDTLRAVSQYPVLYYGETPDKQKDYLVLSSTYDELILKIMKYCESKNSEEEQKELRDIFDLGFNSSVPVQHLLSMVSCNYIHLLLRCITNAFNSLVDLTTKSLGIKKAKLIKQNNIKEVQCIYKSKKKPNLEGPLCGFVLKNLCKIAKVHYGLWREKPDVGITEMDLIMVLWIWITWSIGDLLRQVIDVDENYSDYAGKALVARGKRIFKVIVDNLREMITPYFFRLCIVCPSSVVNHKKEYGNNSRYLNILNMYFINIDKILTYINTILT